MADPINPLVLQPGDEGVVIHPDGTISLLCFEDGPITEQHQALVGAARQVSLDPAFRADRATYLRLALTDAEGTA